jgi:hypothetical protein
MVNSHQLFWQFLPFWLEDAEKSTGSGRARSAVKRLGAIEAGGNRAYLVGVEPFGALDQFIAHVYLGETIPEWLRMAEGK